MTAADRWPCLRVTPEGVRLEVLVAPHAKRTGAMGLHDGALRVRLAAVPAEGAANEALLRWLADGIGVPRSAVTLVRGGSAKRKQVCVAAGADAVMAWLGAVATG